MRRKCKKQLGRFFHVVGFGFLGVIVGIIIGLIFGLLIAYISGFFAVEEFEQVPLALGSFLGMGIGAVVGGIFGGIFGYKD